ncbi:aminopeptidase P family protein [Leucobacter sp. CSA1]|uniref:Aminopeptidase P family protein n=1 Tax=Leucobacter chromiisoli TaxID=2796471 RepID=A0A934Q704_9MICO|nr:M24 family metallopeptidase [Leucobacter chromiisoli]MBK0418901.1 aminopeptidase P family protein [Leucobacter chromiisoli]
MTEAHRNLIAGPEYEERLRSLRGLLSDRGIDAALVWGRGGGSVDRGSDVRYLTGFYPVFPTIRDVPGVWSDRGLCALLVTADEAILFSDDPSAEDAAVGVTSSVARHGVSDRNLAGDVLDELGRRSGIGSLAVVAGDAMSGHHARILLGDPRFADREVVWDDGLVERLRLRKSEAEIALMRRAAAIAEEALEAGFARIAPGVPEAEVVAAMAEAVARNEAVLANAFVYTTPRGGEAEDNRLPVHSARSLQEGDVFTVDLSGVYAGYFFDLARSTVVGAEPTPEQNRAYELAKSSVDRVVERMLPGARLGDAAAAGSALLREAGIDPDDAEFAARGHGLGLGFEAPWVRDDSELVLEPGMIISIEQFATAGGTSATYERNILIGTDGPEDLVAVRDFWPAAEGKETE